MNTFVLVKFAYTDAIKLLCSRVIPTFTCCTPDIEVAGVLAANNLVALECRSRQVLMDGKAFELGVHFFKLVHYRRRCGSALKQHFFREPLKECDLSDRRRVMMLEGNVELTDVCEWKVHVPDSIAYVTRTATEEMVVTAWMWGCTLLDNVMQGYFLQGKQATDDDDDEMDSVDARELLSKAATVFSYLSLRGTTEGNDRFDRDAPMFTKAYACKAYEKLCLALAQIAFANDKLEATSAFNAKCVANLWHAHEYLQDGLELIKNVDGADDVGYDIPVAYAGLKEQVFACLCFYRGRELVINPVGKVAAYECMRKASLLPCVADKRPAMTALMASTAQALTITPPTSTLGAFAGLVRSITYEPRVVNAEALEELRKLTAFVEGAYDSPESEDFAPSSVEEFIF